MTPLPAGLNWSCWSANTELSSHGLLVNSPARLIGTPESGFPFGLSLSQRVRVTPNSDRAGILTSAKLSEAYSYKPGGGLKFKGAGDGPAKKKKKSSTSKRLREEEAEGSHARASGSGGEEGQKERSESPVVGDSPAAGPVSGKTDAQRRFEEVQKKRLLEKAAKAAAKTHKERVAEFNEKLENLSEHYDIPKVGPG